VCSIALARQLHLSLIITITPDGHPRRESAIQEAQNLAVEPTFVDGVRHSDFLLSDLYAARRNLLLAKRNLTPHEVATYASHRKAWRMLLDSDAEHALVLEDDFHAPDPAKLRQAIGDCLAAADRWHIVKFFEFSRKRVWRSARFGSTQLVAYKYQSAGAVAYLINREAARRLLSRKRIFRPVDEDLSWNWEFDLRMWTTESNLVEEISDRLGGSHIEAGRKSTKSERSIVRSIWANVIQAWKLACSVLHHGRCALEGRQRLPSEESLKVADRP
jgi:GR25 family glycosyltransferase involved in LPS biosynthesis